MIVPLDRDLRERGLTPSGQQGVDELFEQTSGEHAA
jgi:hypothetical protein